MINVDDKIKFKEKLVEVREQFLNNSQKIELFGDRVRANVIRMYRDLFFPEDDVLLKILKTKKIIFIFTPEEDLKTNRSVLYNKIFEEYLKSNRAFPATYDCFIKLLEVVKETFIETYKLEVLR